METVFRLNRLLTTASRNARLRTILGALAQQTLRYSRLGLSTQQRRRQSVRHWQELVKAIRDGDGERAQHVAERRVLDSRDAAIQETAGTGKRLTKAGFACQGRGLTTVLAPISRR